MVEPIIAHNILFPDVLWRLPQNVYQKRGRVLIVGGSPGNAKPIIELAEPCLALGVKAVTLAVPEQLANPLRKLVPDLSIVGLPETPTGSLSREGAKTLLGLASAADLTVLGASASKQSETQQLIGAIVPQIPSSLIVLDDGLDAVKSAILSTRTYPTLLVADAGSLARLIKRSGQALPGHRSEVEYIYKEKYTVASRLAQDWGLSILLISPEPLLVAPHRRPVVVPALSPDSLARTLTLLSGTIAALAASQPTRLFECGVVTLVVIREVIKKTDGDRRYMLRDLPGVVTTLSG